MIRSKIGVIGLAVAVPFAVGACDDSSSEGGADGGDLVDGGDAGDGITCSVTLEPAKGDSYERVQEALIDAKTDDTVCFGDGTYSFSRELSLTKSGITLTGNADDREAVTFDFADQEEGADAIKVTGDRFTIEHLSVKNTRGNSIVVQGAEEVTFRNLKVSWDAGSVLENGAYAVYPIGCSDVLIEDSEIVGASDAGVYVGQSTNIIVRNNDVHGNVAGIEIENSDDAVVHGNRAYDNTAGILVFVLPGKEKTDGARCLVRDNVVEDNNRKNFGDAATTVGQVPVGIGVLMLSADDTEVRDNTIRKNNTAGLMAVSAATFELSGCATEAASIPEALMCFDTAPATCDEDKSDDVTDPCNSRLYVHDNTWKNNGQDPDTSVAEILCQFGGDCTTLADIHWDGWEPPGVDGPHLCLGEETSTTVQQYTDNANWNSIANRTTPDVGLSDFDCTLPAIGEVELPQDGDK